MSHKMRKLRKVKWKYQKGFVRVDVLKDLIDQFKKIRHQQKFVGNLAILRQIDEFSSMKSLTKIYQQYIGKDIVGREVEKMADLSRKAENFRTVENVFHSKSLLEAEKEIEKNLARFKDESFLSTAIAEAAKIKKSIDNSSSVIREFEKIRAFEREFSSLNDFERHFEKANAFQKEVDRAKDLLSSLEQMSKRNDLLKAQAFLRARDENYLASLHLEGLDARGEFPTTLADLKAKYAR